MSDQGPTFGGTQPTSIKNTTLIAGGGGYVLLIADYINDCISAHGFIQPSKEFIVMTLVLLAPVVHTFCRIFMKRLERLENDSNPCSK